MVKNKTEFLMLANAWINEAKNDLRRQAVEFMNATETSETELAEMLCISEGEMDQILHGNGEITLSTFAKILIATNHMVEIKPIHAVPFAQQGHGVQYPYPMSEELLRMAKVEEDDKTECDGNDLDGVNSLDIEGDLNEKTRCELCEIIYENKWNDEINLSYASKNDLICFIEDKMAEAEKEIEIELTTEESRVPTDEFEEHASKLAEALRNNPQLVDVLEGILRHKR